MTVSAANGILANDNDADGDTLTAELYSSPSGYLDFHADGSFTYIPNQDFQGDDAFSYRVFDGATYSAIVMVSLAVAPDRVFTVNTLFDTQDDNPGDGNALDRDRLTSLRAAIEEAHALQGNNFEIRFAQNIFGGTINLGIALPNLNKNFTINGLGYNNLTIQRHPAVGNFRIFTINVSKEVTIRDLTLSNGRAIGQPLDDAANGGAIYNSGTLTLGNMILSYNEASQDGGAIYNASNATLSLDDSSVYFNHANIGGGIFNFGSASIEDCEIFVNEATLAGGGIFNGGGTFTIVSTDVYSNQAGSNGGGIGNAGQLTMSGGMLYDNIVTSGNGGGLYNTLQGTANLSDVLIKENQANGANGKGGGVYVYSGTVTLTRCTIQGNICGLQGGGSGGCERNPNTLFLASPTILGQQEFVLDPNP